MCNLPISYGQVWADRRTKPPVRPLTLPAVTGASIEDIARAVGHASANVTRLCTGT
jgi:hypothetical protein